MSDVRGRASVMCTECPGIIDFYVTGTPTGSGYSTWEHEGMPTPIYATGGSQEIAAMAKHLHEQNKDAVTVPSRPVLATGGPVSVPVVYVVLEDQTAQKTAQSEGKVSGVKATRRKRSK